MSGSTQGQNILESTLVFLQIAELIALIISPHDGMKKPSGGHCDNDQKPAGKDVDFRY